MFNEAFIKWQKIIGEVNKDYIVKKDKNKKKTIYLVVFFSLEEDKKNNYKICF